MSGTLLVIGGTGELGSKVVAAAEATDGSGWTGDIIATYHNSMPEREPGSRVIWQSLDVSDHRAVRDLLMEPAHLSSVVYCAIPRGGNANAKYSDVLHNGIVADVEHCAESVAMLGARFIAISTDLVFDGKRPVDSSSKTGGYTEQCTALPINPYGEYKTEMERRLLAISGDIVIARTSLILTFDKDDAGKCGKGVKFVIDCIHGKHGSIELFTDERRNMSFADDLGKALVELADGARCKHQGLIHLVADECSNRWELALLIAKQMKVEHLVGKHVTSGLSAESGLKNRPLNCELSTKLRASVLNTPIRGITERLG